MSYFIIYDMLIHNFLLYLYIVNIKSKKYLIIYINKIFNMKYMINIIKYYLIYFYLFFLLFIHKLVG